MRMAVLDTSPKGRKEHTMVYVYTSKGYEFVERDDDDIPDIYVIGAARDTLDSEKLKDEDFFDRLVDAVDEAAWLVLDGQDRVIWKLEDKVVKVATIHARPAQEEA